MKTLLESMRFVNALPPVADAFSGTVYPAGINCEGIGKVFFIVQKGVGTTGTSTITVVAGDTASPLTETAIPFKYRRIASNNTTIGAVTVAATTGFVTTAGSSDSYIIEVDCQNAGSTDYAYIHLKAVESADNPVLGGVYAFGTDLRWADDTSDIVS